MVRDWSSACCSISVWVRMMKSSSEGLAMRWRCRSREEISS